MPDAVVGETVEMMWYESSRFGRLISWLDDRTPGRLPWGHVWIGPKHGPLRHRFGFHWPSGDGGFALSMPLPRWLPGFVREYQVDGPRRFWRFERCPWWRGSDLSVIVPVLPPGRPIPSRTRRLRRGR